MAWVESRGKRHRGGNRGPDGTKKMYVGRHSSKREALRLAQVEEHKIHRPRRACGAKLQRRKAAGTSVNRLEVSTDDDEKVMEPAQVVAHQRIRPASLGARIRARRLGARLSQAQAVAGAGVSAACRARIEHGERRPSITVLEHIAAHLRVGIDELLRGRDDLANDVAFAASRWLQWPSNARAYEDLVTSIHMWESAATGQPGSNSR
ncbi:helix-turn-helix domain-containing protein [Nocardioides sp. CPCC 206347]|uniref:helix-turn-helix domain-containing protein n=1 Tax=unclassified Nocardioides TaxID=2615069 RepID=UPI003622713A